jgi:hypothetical protein
MAITPSLDARPIGEMTPGELIRFPSGAANPLAVVAGCDFLEIPSALVVILLEDYPDRPGTAGGLLPVNEYMMETVGLSYGRQHIVVVDPLAPAVNREDQRFTLDGALLVNANVRALRTRVLLNGSKGAALYIDLDTWKAVRSEPSRFQVWQFAVLAWEIRPMTDPRLSLPVQPIFTFRAGS